MVDFSPEYFVFPGGSDFVWLLIFGGLVVLGLRRGSRAQTPGQGRSRFPSPRHRRPRPQHEPYDPEDLEDDWDDDERDWDDDEDDWDDEEWDWDDTGPPHRNSRNRRRRSGGWETDDADYI